MKRRVCRADIYRYTRSGNFVAFLPNEGFEKHPAIDLRGDLTGIERLRSVRYIKRDSVQPTGKMAEVLISEIDRGDRQIEWTATLIRILTAADIDIKRWTSTEDLRELPVSPYPDHTPEELAWAGQRNGNLHYALALAAFAGLLAWLMTTASAGPVDMIVGGVFIALLGIPLIRVKWRPKKKADPERLRRLDEHKALLRDSSALVRQAAVSQLEEQLQYFESWKRLSPDQFEHAIARRLTNEGFLKAVVTRRSGDGGVDIEATDTQGKAVIVQAKQYSGNVDVAAVRELVGARALRTDNPRAMLFALVGFTRGARELAEESGIELRAIQEELLHRNAR